MTAAPDLAAAAPPPLTARLAFAGGVLGFALGGFFDGILLHQVLQWHHLFSLVPGERWRDIRNQILMDGWFHVLHYLIALAGLGLLWRARDEFAAPGASRRLLSAVLLGFAVWQAVDTVVFHWVLSIHRVRVDRPNPLFWDIAWFVVVGGPPLALGLWLRRPPPGGPPGRAASAAAMLALLVLVAGPTAALPPSGSTATVVALFRPGTGVAAALGAVAAVGGRVIWADSSGELVAFEAAPSGGTWRLYGRGALLVSGAGPLAGSCLVWSGTADALSGRTQGR